ncbi:MAG: hypothetical protein LBS37_08975 [Treponema sp.]|jgi:hypothetical protein|nr:hypothetical protein [Treponema sp.]
MFFCGPLRGKGGAALILIASILLFPPGAAAQVFALPMPETGGPPPETRRGVSLFPNIYYTKGLDTLKNTEASRPYWVFTGSELDTINRLTEDDTSLLLNNDILAFYGHPNSRNMGILGRYPIEELDAKLTALAGEFEAESGGRRVLKAFYIIYGTVWPEGEIGILKEDTLKRYIEYAQEHNILVFIDHQIGRYDPVDSLTRMLPWLAYPNVHLALDPEWRTTKPMKEIGTVTADEINRAQQTMEDYIIKNNISGERLLVIHQFNWRMIKDRESVRSDFRRVRLVHCADGFGAPHLKRAAYAYNAEAGNIPVKGFKLFYNFGIPGAGYDNPLLSPKEIYALKPRPYVIMYQ